METVFPLLQCRWRQTGRGERRRHLTKATEVMEVTEVSEVTVVRMLWPLALLLSVTLKADWRRQCAAEVVAGSRRS